MATWVGYPASYTKGRNRPIQYVVIHTTEGSEGATSAEAGAAYDKRRTDGVSTHLFIDSDSALQEVPFGDRAHAARFHGNEIGVQIELCGTARQTVAQWHDPVSLAMLRLAAVEVAAICRAYEIPPVRLTVAQVRAAYHAPASSRPKGICGHYDVTRAYPEDGGSHTDPGPAFPWDELLAMVRAELEGDMVTEEDVAKIAKASAQAVVAQILGKSGPTVGVALQRTDANARELVARPAAPPAVVDQAMLKAALLDPEVAAAYAKAVNDDAAARLAD